MKPEPAARPQRIRRPPARYRRVKNSPGEIDRQSFIGKVITSTVDNCLSSNSMSAANVNNGCSGGQSGLGPREVKGSRLHRRQREKGPWHCSECDRPPMGDMTTFRRHVVTQHDKYCSWSGNIRPFVDADEAERVRGVISRAGRRSSTVGHYGTRGSDINRPTQMTSTTEIVARTVVR